MAKSWVCRATKQDLLTLYKNCTYEGKVILRKSVPVISGVTYWGWLSNSPELCLVRDLGKEAQEVGFCLSPSVSVGVPRHGSSCGTTAGTPMGCGTHPTLLALRVGTGMLCDMGPFQSAFHWNLWVLCSSEMMWTGYIERRRIPLFPLMHSSIQLDIKGK